MKRLLKFLDELVLFQCTGHVHKRPIRKKMSSKLEGTNASTKTNDTLEKSPDIQL